MVMVGCFACAWARRDGVNFNMRKPKLSERPITHATYMPAGEGQTCTCMFSQVSQILAKGKTNVSMSRICPPSLAEYADCSGG